MTEIRTAPARTRRSWATSLIATLLTLGTLALIWLVAVPIGPMVCPTIYPAPRNCFTADRASTAIVVTIVLVAVYLMTIAMTLAAPRMRRGAIAGLILLAAAPVLAYLTVAWIPG